MLVIFYSLIIKVMTDWLAPMPDKGLPHVNMRSL